MTPETKFILACAALCSIVAGLVGYVVGHWNGWNDRNNAGDLE